MWIIYVRGSCWNSPFCVIGILYVKQVCFCFFFTEKAMVTHSSTLAWQIPWAEEPGRLRSMGSQGVGHDSATSLSRIGEGNGNLLQCSCLENPRDEGAWWAAICGVAQSLTWLMWLSSRSYLPPETHMQVKKQQNWTWNIRLVPNWEISMWRLYIVILQMFSPLRIIHNIYRTK